VAPPRGGAISCCLRKCKEAVASLPVDNFQNGA
jgi:hypothetical protein